MGRSLLVYVMAALVSGSSAAAASDSPVERASLAGLTDVSVVVEDLAPVAVKAGLRITDLQNDVQQRLKQGGVKLREDADAYLYVQVTVADPRGTLPLAYVVNVSLMQEVTLPRAIRTRTPLQCPTWWMNTVGVGGQDRIRSAVTDRVHEFVDQFIRAYASANPKS